MKKLLFLFTLIHFNFLFAQLNAVFFITNPSCFGNLGTVSIIAEGGVGPYQYSLDSINYQNSNVFTNLHAGTYTAIIKDGDFEILTISFIINEPPPPLNILLDGSLDLPQSTVFANAFGGTPPYTYLWFFNGEIIVDESEQFINILSLPSGTLCSFVQDANGCFVQNCVLINNTFSTNQFAFLNYKTYPNPFQSNLTISNNSLIDEFEITTITGQKLISKTINQKQYYINTSDLSSGIYLLKVKCKGVDKWSKIVKN